MYGLNHKLTQVDGTVLEINKLAEQLRGEAETSPRKIAAFKVRATNYLLAAANALLELQILELKDEVNPSVAKDV